MVTFDPLSKPLKPPILLRKVLLLILQSHPLFEKMIFRLPFCLFFIVNNYFFVNTLDIAPPITEPINALINKLFFRLKPIISPIPAPTEAPIITPFVESLMIVFESLLFISPMLFKKRFAYIINNFHLLHILPKIRSFHFRPRIPHPKMSNRMPHYFLLRMLPKIQRMHHYSRPRILPQFEIRML